MNPELWELKRMMKPISSLDDSNARFYRHVIVPIALSDALKGETFFGSILNLEINLDFRMNKIVFGLFPTLYHMACVIGIRGSGQKFGD